LAFPRYFSSNVIGILLTFILLAQGIPVQQGGTVTGVLRDIQGMPLAGVRMAAVARGDSIEEAATGAAMAGLAETDEQGRFTMENIPPGRYSIAAGRLDLQTYYPGTQSLADATILTITPGATLSGINFALNNASVGRAPGGASAIPNITALIPVRVVTDKGQALPISANGTFISLRLEFGTGVLSIPIDGASFSVPGPIASDVRVVVENLPDTYEVKSITYGSTSIPQGIFKLTSANFATRLMTMLAVPPPVPAPTPAPPTPAPLVNPGLPTVLANGTVSLFAAAQSTSNIIFASTTLKPAATPPSALSITIGESARTSTGGARVSGLTGSTDKRRVYISGKPGTVFSDGTFEFQGVQPGRHLIASVGNSNPFASVVVVGNQDLSGIALKETLMLPPGAREPSAPMPAGPYAPGTIVGLARITGTVIEEIARTPILEGNLTIRAGDSYRTIPIDDKGRFESFYLLPGTYDLRFQIFGQSSFGPSITVEDKDIDIEVTSRRLY
jgi:hypothetical protein